MSWERARYIPWSKLKHDIDGTGEVNTERHKEQIYRELSREADEEERQLKMKKDSSSSSSDNISNSSSDATGTIILNDDTNQEQQQQQQQITTGVPYSTSELFKNLAFGGCIGSITGSVFGFMDGMKSVQDNPIIKNASNMSKSKYLLQGTTRSGLQFGSFFGVYHIMKYGFRVWFDPGQFNEIFISSSICIPTLYIQPYTRPLVPYAAMLITMDMASIFMREMEKDQ